MGRSEKKQQINNQNKTHKNKLYGVNLYIYFSFPFSRLFRSFESTMYTHYTATMCACQAVKHIHSRHTAWAPKDTAEIKMKKKNDEIEILFFFL